MKKYITLITFIILTVSTTKESALLAKIPCETCYQQAGFAYDTALNRYINACYDAIWGTFENLGSVWTAFFSGGMTSWSWGNFWALFFSYGYFDPYWAVLEAEAQWARDLDAMLIIFNYCMAECGGGM